jgi:cytochrome c peroxidase
MKSLRLRLPLLILLLFSPRAHAITQVELGKQLYFDSRLSATGRTSCFTCHNVMRGGEDGHAVSIKPDGKPSAHSAPTVWNAVFLSSYFWYGQAATLEEQAEGPLEEMGLGSLDTVVAQVRAIEGYDREFHEVFGQSPALPLITRAIAAYERTLVTRDSPYDRFVSGEESAISARAKRGAKAFETVGCVSCHSGAVFAGPALPQGSPWLKKFPLFSDEALEAKYHFSDDPGLARVTGKSEDEHVFRVPQLRNIELTAPYFHNGSVTTLDEAVRVMAKLQLGKTLDQPTTDDIVAFLRTLTGEFPLQAMPLLPK